MKHYSCSNLPNANKIIMKANFQSMLMSSSVMVFVVLSSVFAPIIALLVNTSIRCSTLPAQHKRAVFRPRIKIQETRTRCLGSRKLSSHIEFIIHFQVHRTCQSSSAIDIRDLGVLLTSLVNLKAHITSVTRTCFFHLRRIRQVKKCLNERLLRSGH